MKKQWSTTLNSKTGNLQNSGVAKPRHTRARARATSACALAFARRTFKLACFRMLTFRRTVYVALPVPEQLPYSGYATAAKIWINMWILIKLPIKGMCT